MSNDIPHFILKRNLQKSLQTNIYFSDDISNDVLKDICKKITGKESFNVDYVDNDYKDDFLSATYNQGRLIILKYNGTVNYISISEKHINGRNSSIQSVPTAFNLYYLNKIQNKKIYYYFIAETGNYKTEYHIFIYRLMATIGFIFLNDEEFKLKILPFSTVRDLILNRKSNSSKKKNNNSTYITKNENSELEIYGKTYGANKYETSLICYAISELVTLKQTIILYEMLDNDLKELPESSLLVIKKMDKISQIIPISKSLEVLRSTKVNLRNKRYIYNLLEKIGDKHCALCNCAIPEIIQAAHVWDVAAIQKEKLLTSEEKIKHAISGDNGIWLCSNHHKLFDQHIIKISEDGKISFHVTQDVDANFLNEITKLTRLPTTYMSEDFINYLCKRQESLEKKNVP